MLRSPRRSSSPLSLLLAFAVGGLSSSGLTQQAATQRAATQRRAANPEAAFERAGEAGKRHAAALRAVGDAGEREALAFLYEHMPKSDFEAVSPEQLTKNVRLARTARQRTPWGASLSDDLFFGYVLPYAQATETRESWRGPLLEQCLPIVQSCQTLVEAAEKLNGEFFDAVSVHYSTERRRADQSPSESIAQGKASCTGLSILLADACRACCIPARLVSVRWPHKRGNHTWVEVWDGARWRFCGADEPDPKGLDRAWFVGDAKRCAGADREHRIWAVSYAATGERFAAGWTRDANLWGVDVTARYAGPAELAESSAADDALLAQLARWFAADDARRATFSFDRNLDQELRTKAGDARLRALVWRALKTHEREQLQADHGERRVRVGDLEAPYTVETVGERPKGGFGLVIAMHGGGGVPKRINDSQWRHMQVYYHDHPEAGGYLYCALRAPTDDWNGFYTDYFYPLLDKLIRQFVVCDGVDPDKVMAIGYSHGGYGAFAVGPKMPHRFAAVHASAAAPTDGQTSPVGLHTLNFSFMVGGKDTAFGRRERCETFAALLDRLKANPMGGYPATFSLIEGNGHGGLPDRDLLAKLVPLTREPLPQWVAWELTDGTVQDHYWLHCALPRKGAVVTAARKANRLVVDIEGPGAFEAWLDARLYELTKPVLLVLGGEEFSCTPEPSLATLCQTMEDRGDPQLAASWALPLRRF
ncbi:MAG: transglutaminase domain-containing protein [Planctomycetota bacterium]